MNRQLDVKNYLKEISYIIKKYNFEPSLISHIDYLVDKINNRSKDNNLYLGIVGEFSSGKTSFINALIRDNLLKTDAIQATTSSATYIRYGKILDVVANLKNGSSIKYRDTLTFGQKLFKSISNMLSSEKASSHEKLIYYIHELTSNESVARDIESVIIEHHAPILHKNKIVIIDTPGTDASNDRHTEVARQIIKESCDAILVVIDKNKPLSQNLITFIDENLSDALPRCIFILTKIDQIDSPNEKDILTKNVANRIKKYLGYESPLVLTCSPGAVIDSFSKNVRINKDISSEDRKNLLNNFIDTESQILKQLEINRNSIQLDALINLLNKVLNLLKNELEKEENHWSKLHEEIEKNSIKNLPDYSQEFLNNFNDSMDANVNELFDAIHMIFENAAADMIQNIEQKNSKEALENYIENTKLSTSLNLKISNLINLYYTNSNLVEKKYVNEFNNDLLKKYKRLVDIAGNLIKSKSINEDNQSENSFKDLDELTSNIGSIVSNEQFFRFAGGAGKIGGAVVLGTILFPGLGTLIGAGVGFLWNLFTEESIEKLREKYKEKVIDSLNLGFSTFKDSNYMKIENMNMQIKLDFEKNINSACLEYSKLAKELQIKDNEQLHNLNTLRKKVFKDKEYVSKMETNLAEIRKMTYFQKASA